MRKILKGVPPLTKEKCQNAIVIVHHESELSNDTMVDHGYGLTIQYIRQQDVLCYVHQIWSVNQDQCNVKESMCLWLALFSMCLCVYLM